MFQEVSSLKNLQAIMGITTNTQNPTQQSAESYHELQLEQENLRKKVKRLTGELDVLETYFNSF